MGISSRRVLLVATITGGVLVGGAAPALAQPDVDLNDVTERVSDLPLPAQQDESPLQPVTELVCQLTGIELLGSCEAEAVPEPGAEKPAPAKPAPDQPVGHQPAGDSGAAPVGGVETGAGGTAEDGAGLLLPLGVAGGAVLTGAAIAGARRLRVSQLG